MSLICLKVKFFFRSVDQFVGFFVQWVMCAAIFLAGMVVNVFEDFSTFHPLAMLGGSLWAIGLLCIYHYYLFVKPPCPRILKTSLNK